MAQIEPYSIGLSPEEQSGKIRILFLDKPFVELSGDGIDVLVAVHVCSALNLMEKVEQRKRLQEELWAAEERLDRIHTEPLEI